MYNNSASWKSESRNLLPITNSVLTFRPHLSLFKVGGGWRSVNKCISRFFSFTLSKKRTPDRRLISGVCVLLQICMG